MWDQNWIRLTIFNCRKLISNFIRSTCNDFRVKKALTFPLFIYFAPKNIKGKSVFHSFPSTDGWKMYFSVSLAWVHWCSGKHSSLFSQVVKFMSLVQNLFPCHIISQSVVSKDRSKQMVMISYKCKREKCIVKNCWKKWAVGLLCFL